MDSNARTRSWLLVAVVYCLLVVACFSPWWFGGKLFAPLDILNQMLPPWSYGIDHPQVHNHFVSDAVTQYIPYHMLASRSIQETGYIGWNPYSETGAWLSANTMALPGDWTLQLYRWFDFWTTWHLGLIGQYLIAGLGMLVFLRDRGCHPWAALAAAIAFAASGQFIVWFFHRWALACFCWIPWLMWALYRVFLNKVPPPRLSERVGWGLLASGFLALAFLGGTLQHAVYVVLAVGGFWAAEVIFRPFTARQKVAMTLALATIGILGVLLAGPAIFPCLDAYLQSRAAGDARGAIGYPKGFAQPILNLLVYPFNIYPSILGSPQTLDMWKAFKSGLFDVAYLGAIPTTLAFFALARKTAPTAARWLIAVGLILPLTPLVGPLYHRVLLLFAFGGAWVLADFFTHSSDRTRSTFARWGLMISLGITSIWAVTSMALLFFAPQLRQLLVGYVTPRLGESQFGMFREWFIERTSNYVDTLFLWSPAQWPLVILILVGFSVIWLGANKKLPTNVWQAALCMLLALELTTLAARWVTIVDPSVFPPYAETAEITEIREAVGSGRLFQETAGKSIAAVPLAPNIPSVFGIRHLTAYDSIRPAGPWAETGYSKDPAVLASLGVSHFLQSADNPPPAGWQSIWRKNGMELFQNAHAVAKITEEEDRELHPLLKLPLIPSLLCLAVGGLLVTRNRNSKSFI